MYSKEYIILKELLIELKKQLEEDKILQDYYYFIEKEEVEKIYERYISRII